MQVVREKAPEDRPNDARRHEHRRGIALNDWALARAQQIGDHGLRKRQESAATESLERPSGDEKWHGGRDRTAQRPCNEYADADQHHAAPAINVGKLAEQRRRHCGADEIGGHNPRKVLDIAEYPPHRRQGRCHDGLFERGEKHRQHDAEDDRERSCVTLPQRRPDIARLIGLPV